MSRACFAYSKDRLRCDQDAGHEGTHTFTTYWTDDECFDPALDSTTIWRDKPTSGGAVVTMNAGQILAPDIDGGESDVAPGRCFTCNCTEAAHVPGEGCAAHACKSFLP